MKDIEKVVGLSLKMSLLGQSVERPNVEFKREWPNLIKKEKAYYEFLKDVCALANTVSDKFGVIIFGYDDKNREFRKVSFSDTQLRDSSDLHDLIVRNITEPFEVKLENIVYNDNILNVLIINKSFAKPHVIKKYIRYKNNKNGEPKETHLDNFIPIRKESKIVTANKYDLDAMYYDRKNILFERKIYISLFSFEKGDLRDPSIAVSIENIGLRSASIVNLELKVVDVNSNNIITCKSRKIKNLETKEWIDLNRVGLIIKPNHIKHLAISLKMSEEVKGFNEIVIDDNYHIQILALSSDGLEHIFNIDTDKRIFKVGSYQKRYVDL